MKRNLTLLILVLLAAWWAMAGREVRHGPGAVAAADPVQTTLRRGGEKFAYKKNYVITPLAEFAAHARVLSRKRYRWDSSSGVSPIDLALGWGPMSDEKNLDPLSIRQYGRWYHWSARDVPIPRDVIESHSANMHMIPADKAVARRLNRLRRGDVIALSGYLVRVTGPNGFRWESSLSRTDTGAKACEIVYVERLRVVTDQAKAGSS